MFHLLIPLLVGSIVLPASAGEFDYILGDLKLLEEDLKWQIDAEVQAIEDHTHQESDELFLDVEDERVPSDGLPSSSPFISVKVDGIPITFADVPSDSWFGPYVRSAAEKGIVSGYRDANGRLLGNFGPADNVTIEQLAKMALQSSGIELHTCAGVPKNESAVGTWSEHYISCAEQRGWAVFTDGSVDVLRPATRSEVVVTIVQAFSIDFTRGTGEIFDDVTASTEFSGAIEMSASAGVIEGYKDENDELTGSFGPEDPVNRAEVAKIVTLAKSVYGEQ